MALIRPHSSSLVYLGICGIGVLAFFGVGVYPNMAAMDRLDDDIRQLTVKVQEQELLHPLYRELIKQVQQQPPNELPLPDKIKIDRKSIADINEIFITLAEENGVVFESAVPDPSSYLEEAQRLTMNVTYSGDFFNFRKLLLSLCKMPYLASIEQMQVKTEGAVKRIRFRLLIDQE